VNIQHLLRLTRPLLFFDLETTGPNAKSDRIVEIGLIQFKPDGTIKEWRSLINPERPISKEATEKHGIDEARLANCNICGQSEGDHPYVPPPEKDQQCEQFHPIPTFGQLASNLVRGFTDTDFAGYNIKTFDLPVMQAEFQRAGIEWKFDTAKILDGFRLWQIAEPRTLSDFVQRWTGQPLEEAHHALADVRGTLQGVVDLLTTVQHLPRDLEQLHDLLWPARPRDPNWIDSTGKFIWVRDVPYVNFGKAWKDKPMHLVKRRFWEWMIDPAQSFEPDAVEIARNMLSGKLPKRSTDDVGTLGTPADDSERSLHVGEQGAE
jgi:DNA polymerase-3 subunit epsilon